MTSDVSGTTVMVTTTTALTTVTLPSPSSYIIYAADSSSSDAGNYLVNSDFEAEFSATSVGAASILTYDSEFGELSSNGLLLSGTGVNDGVLTFNVFDYSLNIPICFFSVQSDGTCPMTCTIDATGDNFLIYQEWHLDSDDTVFTPYAVTPPQP
jgi:hypothetical protein